MGINLLMKYDVVCKDYQLISEGLSLPRALHLKEILEKQGWSGLRVITSKCK